ncbi:hypothetical protein PENTCL1PPCAC_28662 [Pristionchus entomophagus]|uniref:Protein tweety homolog n=1 Tax=Pristionchus entomophagus TaxID=358040 RepID=A0AAV5UJJ8_9BILA|nr:hypothetical protein PENTCL1PPCAC_28662 [Pristionchus entomophagus]
MIQFIINTLHSIPHFNFHFQQIKPTFVLNVDSEYTQSLILLCGLVLSVALLLLLTIIITWVCQCCARTDTTVKPRRKVKRLSVILFVLSIFCFFFLGFCLFGNDKINRGVQSSIVSLHDVNNQIKIGLTTSGQLNEISRNASTHIKNLEQIVLEKSKKPGTNQTMVSEIDTLLTSLSDSIDTVMKKLEILRKDFSNLSVLEKTKNLAELVEFERWLLLVILLSIMLCVLFAGVISFCRQSKKGAVGFSGVGILIFIVCWALLAIVLPLAVALADFCGQGGDFLADTVSQPILKSLAFYSECDPRPTHDNLPPHLGISNMSDELSNMQGVKTKLDSLMDTAFNKSEDVQKASSFLLDDGTRSLKTIGALENSFACYAYKEDLKTMKEGLCGQAVLGSAVVTLCLILLALFMFTLLLIVSKSWNLFTRLGNDYVEVGDDDPFFPRGNTDTSIPVDIYGTHMFNPRTRERTEPSTGTTTATANGGEERDPLWSRAPPVTANAAGGPSTVGWRNGSVSGTLLRETGSVRSPYDDRYGNYNDQYDL